MNPVLRIKCSASGWFSPFLRRVTQILEWLRMGPAQPWSLLGLVSPQSAYSPLVFSSKCLVRDCNSHATPQHENWALLTGTWGTIWCLLKVRKRPIRTDGAGLHCFTKLPTSGWSLLPSDGKFSRLINYPNSQRLCKGEKTIVRVLRCPLYGGCCQESQGKPKGNSTNARQA